MKSAESHRWAAGAAACIISPSRKKTADSLFFHRTGTNALRTWNRPAASPEKPCKFMAMAEAARPVRRAAPVDG
jgi:hypothetical protein